MCVRDVSKLKPNLLASSLAARSWSWILKELGLGQPGEDEAVCVVYMSVVCVYVVHLNALLFCLCLSAGGQSCPITCMC